MNETRQEVTHTTIDLETFCRVCDLLGLDSRFTAHIDIVPVKAGASVWVTTVRCDERDNVMVNAYERDTA